jgi:hypothetical protein
VQVGEVGGGRTYLDQQEERDEADVHDKAGEVDEAEKVDEPDEIDEVGEIDEGPQHREDGGVSNANAWHEAGVGASC